MESIHIYLSPMQNGLPARELTLTQEDPAAQDLLALLGSQVYDVWYDVGAGGGHQILLDYTVYMTLSMEPEGRRRPWRPSPWTGLRTWIPMFWVRGVGAAAKNWVRTYYRADLAFQQEVLDLPLAQPYEEVL